MRVNLVRFLPITVSKVIAFHITKHNFFMKKLTNPQFPILELLLLVFSVLDWLVELSCVEKWRFPYISANITVKSSVK
jgi:hypothetical protein